MLNDTDCDDGDPLQKPGGVETATAPMTTVTVIDEEDAVDRWEFFYDGDQDGHGIPDPSLMISACTTGWNTWHRRLLSARRRPQRRR